MSLSTTVSDDLLSTTDTVSSSSTVTARSDLAPAYSAARRRVDQGDGVVGLASVSSLAFTVTVCASSQVVASKVRVSVPLRPLSSRSVVSWPVTVTVTSTDGSWESFTV